MFQDALSRVDVMSDYLMQTLFGSIVPIYDFHCGLLKELDQRLAIWLGRCKYFLLMSVHMFQLNEGVHQHS